MTQKNNVIKIIIFSIVLWGAIFIAPFILHANIRIVGTGETIKNAYENYDPTHGHVIYVTYGGMNHPGNRETYDLDETNVILKAPYRSGYVFGGWYYDEFYDKPVKSISFAEEKNILVYAKWDARINNYENVQIYPYEQVQHVRQNSNNQTNMLLLKDLSYEFVDDFNIPGMPSTKEDDLLSSIIFSTAQCPQGFTFTDEYILITSYSTEEESMGELMVFDIHSFEYLVTLAMDSNSHLGGVAFDGANVWICNSEEKAIERIAYDFVKLMVNENRGKVVDASAVVDSYPVKYIPSCITIHEGMIWIASHNKVMDSQVATYYYDSFHDKLDYLNHYNIPAKVQGIAFDSNNHVYLSTSYGRNSSSYLKIYESIITLSAEPSSPDILIEMPPGSEEIDIDEEGNVYIIFETAGEKYLLGTDGNGKSKYPLDKLLKVKEFNYDNYLD